MFTNRKIKKYGFICYCGRFKQLRTNRFEGNDTPRNLSDQSLREVFIQSLTSYGIKICKKFEPTHGSDLKNCFICRFNPTRTHYSLYDIPLFLNVTAETKERWEKICYEEVAASSDGTIFARPETADERILSQESQRLFEFYNYVYLKDPTNDTVMLQWFD